MHFQCRSEDCLVYFNFLQYSWRIFFNYTKIFSITTVTFINRTFIYSVRISSKRSFPIRCHSQFFFSSVLCPSSSKQCWVHFCSSSCFCLAHGCTVFCGPSMEHFLSVQNLKKWEEKKFKALLEMTPLITRDILNKMIK